MNLRIVNVVLCLFMLADTALAKKKIENPQITSRLKANEQEQLKSSIFSSELEFDLDFTTFIELVKKYHPEIIAAELEAKIAKAKILEAEGAFDPSVNSNTGYKRFNSSSSPGEDQNAFVSANSLDWKNSYSASISLGADFAQGDTKSPISPTGSAGEYFLKLQIPFLRNAIYNASNVKLKSQKLAESIASYALYRKKLDVLEAAARAYWSLSGAWQALAVEENLLILAEKQLGFVDEQVKAGNMPAITMVETQTEIAKRRSKVAQAQRDYQRNLLQVSRFIWQENGKPMDISTKLKAIDNLAEPQDFDNEQLALARQQALKQRPEMMIIENSRGIVEYESKYAHNQMLPALDLYLSPGFQAGSESVDAVGEAGLSVSLPLRTRRARGLAEQAELKLNKLSIDERQLIQNIFLELDDVASQIHTSYDRYHAALSDVEYSLKLQEGEQTKFDLGDSTLFVVIRRERATAEAQVDLLKSLVDYHVAKFKFELVQGNL